MQFQVQIDYFSDFDLLGWTVFTEDPDSKTSCPVYARCLTR